MTYSFRYTQQFIPPTAPFPQGQIVYRPMIISTIRVPSTGLSVNCFTCLDSGADQCVFPTSFVSRLGLNPLTMPMDLTGGVGSAANVTYYAQVEIHIPGLNPPMAPFDVYAGFTSGMNQQGIGLLGQSGFFDKFVVAFDHPGKVFHIHVS